jgi:hypothetical protein
MTDSVVIVSDTANQNVNAIELTSDLIVITENISSQTFEIIENNSYQMQVIDQNPANNIDGIPVIIGNPQQGDVISYSGAVFRNRSQLDLTDGGIF